MHMGHAIRGLIASCRKDIRSTSEPRSERKKRLYTSLTELTEAALSEAKIEDSRRMEEMSSC